MERALLWSGFALGWVGWMRAEIIDSLAGLAIGWLCVSIVLSLDTLHPTPYTLTFGSGYATALACTAALGVYRGTVGMETYIWSAVAVLIGAMAPFAVLV